MVVLVVDPAVCNSSAAAPGNKLLYVPQPSRPSYDSEQCVTEGPSSETLTTQYYIIL